MRVNFISPYQRLFRSELVNFTLPPLLGIILGALVLGIWQLRLNYAIHCGIQKLEQLHRTLITLDSQKQRIKNSAKQSPPVNPRALHIIKNRIQIVEIFTLFQQNLGENLDIKKLEISDDRVIISGYSSSLERLANTITALNQNNPKSNYYLEKLDKREINYEFSMVGKFNSK